MRRTVAKRNPNHFLGQFVAFMSRVDIVAGFTDKAVVIRNLGAIGRQCYEKGLGAYAFASSRQICTVTRDPGSTMSDDRKTTASI